MKNIKKLICLILCVLFAFSLCIFASAEGLKTGDVIYYGTYPQSEVTDEELISELNNQEGSFISFGYYYNETSDSFSFTDGKMKSSDYMKYKDVILNGEKYRAITFDKYRPNCTGFTTEEKNTEQADNGYNTGATYWFKYEPLEWRVLDPEAGLVVCNTLIDAQPLNNYMIVDMDSSDWTYAHYGDKNFTNYASDYVTSSLRVWLNRDFYNTAFSENQKDNIAITNLNNDGTYTLSGKKGYEVFDGIQTEDNVFLLSYSDITNSSYGFKDNSSRIMQGTQYAKCQGLWEDGSCYWRLRSPGISSLANISVLPSGSINDANYFANLTYLGICPAMTLKELKSDTSGSEINYKSPEIGSCTITIPKSGKASFGTNVVTASALNIPEGCFVQWFDGNNPIGKKGEMSASCRVKLLFGSKKLTAKIVDENGKVVSSETQEKSLTIKPDLNPIKLISYIFKALFGNTQVNKLK